GSPELARCRSNLSASQAQSTSTSTFLTSLVFNSAVFGAEIVAFTILRRQFRSIYEPRSLSVLESKRQKPLSPSLLAWPLAIWRADYRDIKQVNGMDSYFFVRFLRMMVRVLLPIWLISWVILLPITAIKTEVESHSGLDKYTYGNVAPDKTTRYAAHLILAWVFTFWIWWNIKHEMQHYVKDRQRFLISASHSSSPQANTILVTGIPTKYLSELALTRLFSCLPGGVRKVWLNRDLKDMPDLHTRRLAACDKLEAAETSLLGTAMKQYKKNKEAAAKKGGDSNSSTGLTQPTSDPEAVKSLAEELVPANERPTHRLPPFSWLPFSLPLIGKKVDSIEWAREEIKTTSEALAERRRDQTYPPVNGAFILFNRQIAAHLAAAGLTHHGPYRMASAGKYVEVGPEDVIWENLGMNPYERRIRMAIGWAITLGLIILWAFPVAFVGAVSNIHSLCIKYHWLAWVCDLPDVVVGIISGILPPVLLAILFMLLPIVLRLLARLEGIPKRTGLELSLMDRFFIFEVINGFLIVTLSSGIIAALPQLADNISSAPTLLAQNLPKASTFFLTYIMLQGLSGTAGGFLQAVTLILYYVKLILLGSTPRSVYNLKYGARSVNWGTLFPQTTLLVVITLGYSIISPIINGLACATFFLFYIMYKYLFLWVQDMPASGDTGGLFFPKAIQHIFVGLYIQQICLCALFFLSQNEKGKPAAIAEGALMVVLLVFTAFFHNIINNSYGPLIQYLPLTLADKSFELTDDVVPGNASAMALPVEETEKKGRDSTEQGPTDFSHPASVESQRVIWLPRDPLGLVEEAERACKAEGIDVSTEGAIMNEKGKVNITSAPPEEAMIDLEIRASEERGWSRKNA
ncbi:hypothetical protein HETIRDRAFT_324961, partial [Heterobasidion irregulare TC 32-1]